MRTEMINSNIIPPSETRGGRHWGEESKAIAHKRKTLQMFDVIGEAVLPGTVLKSLVT